MENSNGFVEEYWSTQQCTSPVLVPGTSLMNDGFMGVVYLLWLGYLFLGIAIISDIFMEAIESITDQTIKVEYWDKDKTQHVTIEKLIWNPTVANLTLMALGSSAPEILLSVISSIKDIEAIPPELGPSTIVGSASFNLLVISGVSIIAVGGDDCETKCIEDMWVFAVTSIFGLWAYIWMWICVDDGYISVTEGVLTCVFFVALIVLAYTADRVNNYRMSQRMSHEDQERMMREEEQKLKKDRLRAIAREYSDNAVIEVAQKVKAKESAGMADDTRKEIRNLFCELYKVTDSAQISIQDLLQSLQPEKCVSKSQFRRKAADGSRMIQPSGPKQTEMNAEESRKHVKVENDHIGFKCLHYSVTESAGHVEITIIKKMMNHELSVGVRTIDDTAVAPKDYKAFN
jgi:solute carrier family 8 (sodium/calcium exchanger)